MKAGIEESLPGRLPEGGVEGHLMAPPWHRGAGGNGLELRGDGKALSVQTNVSG